MKSKNEEIEPSAPEVLSKENDIPSVSKVISSMPKESLKSLLYLVAGKQDSNFKLFTKLVVITYNDIIELNDLIQEKLAQHNTPASFVSVSVVFKDSKAIEFGTWQEFLDFNWKIPNIIENIIIKWDFMIKLPNFAIPQIHTLTVKFLAKMNPIHILQAIFSKDPDEIDEIEFKTAPIICRVDFINHLLSDELINIVEKWVASRRKPYFINPTTRWLKIHSQRIKRFTTYSFPFFISILFLSILGYIANQFDQNTIINVKIFKYFFYWAFFSGVSIPLSFLLGKYIGNLIYKSIDNYGRYRMFEITNGDKNELEKFKSKDKGLIRKFVFSSFLSIILNLIAAYLSYIFFKS